ncbi:DUF4232 domain-containing protein [Plantibacter sp. PA-3-X8]|uniref:DUF4232 domain-containing protein n=1 Tax=Plantibacter sp. PA-3-X8 TaxID=2480625 RepID=UPI000F5DAE2E|nr:DUF4232 domain-containing protein [Plantibacter sp. PA-3-X8]AZH84189.1 DUF4232 domain-containing protein [Plantibacter sp. PA-3-X8]
MRRSLLTITPLAVVLLLAGCAGSPAPSPSAIATSAAPSPTSSPTSTAAVDPNAPAGQCADSVLQVTVSGADAGAGSIFSNVVFTNTGRESCVLRGAPGVSVVGDGDGTQLGAAAVQQEDAAPADVTLPAGGSASATLTSVNIGSDGGPLDDCEAVTGDGYRVYPPHSFTAVFVASSAVPACSNTAVAWMTIGPVRAD